MKVPGVYMILKFLWALPLVLRGISWCVPSLEHKVHLFKFSWFFFLFVGSFSLISILTHFVCELRQLSNLVNSGQRSCLLFLRMLWRTGLSFLFLFFSGIHTRFCKQCPLMYWYLHEHLFCSFVLTFLISFSISVFPRPLQFLSCGANGTMWHCKKNLGWKGILVHFMQCTSKL